MKYLLNSVKGKKSFSEIFESGIKIYERNSMAVFLPAQKAGDENTGSLKISFSVFISKKNARHAVVRNRIKRLMRESVRHFFNNLPKSGDFFPVKAFSLIWRTAPKHPALIGLKDVEPEVFILLSKGMEQCRKSV